ncbi:MAG: polyprenyl synthetase family protein [Gemmataceae bacterium]|nr:polyprenyl synthetase family protein [Gemmataceae bacterium]
MVEADVKPQEKRLSSAAFKVVPQARELRDRIRSVAADVARPLDRGAGLTKPHLQQLGEGLLKHLGEPEDYLGFAMVCVANEFWREQVMAVPFSRRLMLLPHCLKNAEGCPADYDEFGLDCLKCGACSVADYKGRAEQLGYKVLVSEGTPIVLKIIVSGHVDAIVGVACLNVLEKAIDKILLAGIPCVAAPLLSSNCKSTSVDNDWVFELINLHKPADLPTKTWMHLMRSAFQSCEEPNLSRLAPRSRTGKDGDPIAVHEAIAYDWMAQGGKRSRPFITLAAYDALKGGAGTHSAEAAQLPDPVQRVALAIEAFHKASLVHDDIEDDDTFRYGRTTLHRQYGVGTAINIGDYLLGLGYRLISRERKTLGADCAADILDKLAEAHLRLSEGQGAELLWRDARDKSLTALDALKIYALKTSPAFEAALYAGVRLAGPAEALEKPIHEFCKNLGVAFQILNDFKDWEGDDDNKLVAGQDALAARPTLLLALALEGSSPEDRRELLALLGGTPDERTVEQARSLFDKAGAFAKARKLTDKFRAKAEALADEAEPAPMRELLYFLVDSVLERKEAAAEPPVLQLLPLGPSR